MSTLLYDSDGSDGNPATRRQYSVRDCLPQKLTASGLDDDECVQIYVLVGSSSSTTATGGTGHCPPGAALDHDWAPLFRCGEPVMLCGDNNEYIERIPGNYMIGPPDAAPVFAGDVNISTTPLSKEYLYVQPYCAGGTGDQLDQTFCPTDPFLGVITDLSLLTP